ncbi:hypothetical protein ACJX0J_013545, partial [Zea mays]
GQAFSRRPLVRKHSCEWGMGGWACTAPPELELPFAFQYQISEYCALDCLDELSFTIAVDIWSTWHNAMSNIICLDVAHFHISSNMEYKHNILSLSTVAYFLNHNSQCLLSNIVEVLPSWFLDNQLTTQISLLVALEDAYICYELPNTTSVGGQMFSATEAPQIENAGRLLLLAGHAWTIDRSIDAVRT